ncbi:MAG TPA: hypothetical protein VG245_10650, partial [Candidatus Dormibacteraeota bacterium]|nr:hypothetical protein [Candidatus Dormibacteraeota bacterium]
EARAAEEATQRRRREAAEAMHRLEERIASLALLSPAEEPPHAGARRLVEVIEVEDGAHAAVEAALGADLLQAWVAESATAEAAIAAGLAAGRFEGGLFLAHAAGARPPGPAAAGGVAGAESGAPSGRAAAASRALRETVTAPAWLAPALDALLGECWLVPDLDAARELCRRHPAALAVTPGGQALRGWHLRSRPRARQLDAQHRLRRAEADLEQARRDLAQADQQALSARVAVESTAADLERARAAEAQAAAADAASVAAEAAGRRQAEALASRLERNRAGLERRRAELAETDDRAAGLRSGLAALAGIAALAAEVEALAVTEAAAREAAESLRWAAESGRARRAALASQREATRARVVRAEQVLARQAAELETLGARMAAHGDAIEALAASRAATLAEAAVAQAALAAEPDAAPADDVESLAHELLAMEKENLDRQVALAHQEEVLLAATSLLETEAAALAELTERMGASGTESAEDSEVDWERTQREIARLERQIQALGPVNLLAIEELERDSARLGGIDGQLEDLRQARTDLDEVAARLTEEIDRRFDAVFGAVAFNFQETFASLFPGGRATLRLEEGEVAEPGVEIMAQPAGKRMRGIRLLSGGERALTALAFILALEKVNPSPFYIFDEVDAPLDDANVRRFSALLRTMAADNQFILITHNHATMTAAGALYGVTLEDSGVSRVVSVRLQGETVVPAAATA